MDGRMESTRVLIGKWDWEALADFGEFDVILVNLT